MKKGIKIEEWRDEVRLNLFAWTKPGTDLMDVCSSATANLSVDDAEEVAQHILSVCQDIRRGWLARDAQEEKVRYDYEEEQTRV